MEILTGLLGAGFLGVVGVALFLVYVLVALAGWNIFRKAGVAGWKSLIPGYNLWLLFEIAELPGWFALPTFVTTLMALWTQAGDLPSWLTLVSGLAGMMAFVFNIAKAFKLAEVFDRGLLHILGLIFLPSLFELILAYGPARYVGSYGEISSR